MKRQKLSFKLAYWIVLTSTVLTFISSTFYLYHEYDVRLENFEQEITNIHEKNLKVLNHSIWHYDKIAIKAFLEDTVDVNRITYAKINISNKLIETKGIPNKNNVIEKRFVFSKIIEKHKYIIGELVIQGNKNVVWYDIKNLALNIFLAEFFKVIFMTTFIIFLLKKLFVDKLEKMATYAGNLSIDNLKDELFIPSNTSNISDEFDTVFLAFDDMRKNLLNEINQSNEIKKELVSFRHAIEKSYNSIVITDLERNITYVNNAFENTTGYSKEEAIGKNPNILKSPKMRASIFIEMNKQLDEGLIWQGELVNIKKNGSTFYEQASIIPIFIDNKLSSYLAIKLDITAYKESEEKIRRLNLELEQKVKERTLELVGTNKDLVDSINDLKLMQEQLLQAQEIANTARKNAEEANREKSMFLANISHELKTPLNGISGLVYLSKLRVQDKEVAKNLSSIQAYSETLLRMISDLLDSSKTDAKHLTIEKSTFNLNDMLESLNQLYTMQCADKDIEFELHYDKDIPINLISDPVRLHQVITNLLNNAIKFTHQGKVRLDAQIQSSNEKQIKMKFIVKDDGIGIKEKELKNIFKPFYQTKESLNYYAGGSGLGLNISQKIVEQLDGIIWADSVIDKGSTFFVILEFDIDNNEITAIEHKNEDIKNISDNANKKVLVVDDNEININVLTGILKSIGITCDSAINGLEALNLVKQTKYDIVLTDIKMPVMGGCELAKHIRERYDKDELPIIAISANNPEKGMLCAKQCGVNDYIQKPINPDSFLITLQKQINCNINQIKFIEQIDTQGNSILDVPDALKRFVNNNELYTQALRSFINDYGDSVDKIKGLINSKNTNDLIDYLHTIKGISANLSAKEFSLITAKFHDNVKYGKDYKNLLNEYGVGLNNLKKEIEEYLGIQEDVIENENLLNDKDEVLNILLEYCNGHNTKAIHFFKEVSYKLKEDSLLSEIQRDVINYNFKKAKEKIEKYIENNSK